jgi:AraC-like DNA-binding protein
MKLEQTRPDGLGRARGLVSSRKSGQRVAAATYAPPQALADVVECFWSTRWNLPAHEPHHVEVLTDPSMQLVFERGASRVVGVTTKLFRRSLHGRGLIRAVRLRAGAASAVLALPSVFELTDQVVPLRSFFSQLPTVERRVLAKDDSAGFAQLSQWLLSVRQPLSENARLAVMTVDRLRQRSEVTSVAEVCQLAGLSIRPLQRLFRDFVGVSPKWVIRRERLREVALALEKGTERSLADLAASLGYADHAHLTRDFRQATGKLPSAFAKDVWR